MEILALLASIATNMNMKRFLLFNILWSICFYGYSQINYLGGSCDNIRPKIAEEIKVDTCLFECIYHHIAIDPTLDYQQREEYNILQIGREVCKYGGYSKYRVDSVLNYIDKERITTKEYTELVAKLQFDYNLNFLFKEISTGKITVFDRVFTDRYIYNDSVDFNWILTDSTSIICGQECHQATCQFRGRTWFAWYCDIPVALGPWKFCGLPGLILKVEDSRREHVFCAINIRPSHSQITKETRKYTMTERAKFNKALEYYMANSSKIVSNSNVIIPINRDGSARTLPKRRRFFNPIEKE